MTASLRDVDRPVEPAPREDVTNERRTRNGGSRSSPAPDIGLITATTRAIDDGTIGAAAVFAVLKSHTRML